MSTDILYLKIKLYISRTTCTKCIPSWEVFQWWYSDIYVGTLLLNRSIYHYVLLLSKFSKSISENTSWCSKDNSMICSSYCIYFPYSISILLGVSKTNVSEKYSLWCRVILIFARRFNTFLNFDFFLFILFLDFDIFLTFCRFIMTLNYNLSWEYDLWNLFLIYLLYGF